MRVIKGRKIMSDVNIKNQKPLKRAFKNVGWALSARLLTMLIKFFTVPIVLSCYGKVEYGLIVLASSLSGYMSIANLALPIGMIKHTAAWLGTGDFNKLEKASRSSFTFYGLIGFINASIFLVLAFWGVQFFNVPLDKEHTLKVVFIISAFGTLLTWPFSVVEQLLSGAEEIAWLEKINILQEILIIFITLIAIWLNLGIVYFYLLILTASNLSIPVNLWKWSKYVSLKKTFIPGWYWKEFKSVLSYGLGLLVIGLSMTSAMQLRPIILAANSGLGIAAATDYRVLFGITGIIVTFQGAISRSLLPVASKAFAVSDQQLIETIIFKGTKYIWAVLALMVFGLIMVSDRLLIVYVGYQYVGLAPWLSLWLLSFMFFYIAPVASVVMGSGKIRFLMISSPIAAVISITIAWFLSPKLGVGAVAISTLVYYSIAFLIYHVYYLPLILKISPLKLLSHSFIQPVIAGTLLIITGRWSATSLSPNNPYLWIVISGIVGSVVYVVYILLFSVSPAEIKKIFFNLRAKKIGLI